MISKKLIKKIAIALVVVITLIAIFVIGSHVKTTGFLESAIDTRQVTYSIDLSNADIATGERIATIRNGCVDCHGKDFSGKLVIDDPMLGKINGTNLTPYALGQWTDEEIIRAIRNGIGRDARPLILMPSHEYALLGESDIASLVAYLRSLAPIEKENKPVSLGLLGKVLFATGQAKTLISASIVGDNNIFPEKPEEVESSEFGKYLAMTGCSGCHGPTFAGGPIPGGDPSWPQASSLIGLAGKDYTKQDFINALKLGQKKDGSKIRPPMPISLSSQFNETEISSLWLFFKKLNTAQVN